MSVDTDKIREKAERLHWTILIPGRLLLETCNEIDRLRAMNDIGKALVGLDERNQIEQDTKEACLEAAWKWYSSINYPDVDRKKTLKQAIDSVGKK